MTAGAAPPIPPEGLPDGRVVNVPGRGEMFVRESRGPGPAIALLHGWTASADLNWFRAYAALGQLGQVVAMDHRGHGRGIRSDDRFTLEDAADDVAALLRDLGAVPAVLVGYSMGGPISLLTARRHPDVVRGLVLVATALEWRARRRERLLWKTMAIAEWMLRLGRPRGILDRTLRLLVRRAPDLEPLVPWFRGELRRGDPQALADVGRALGDYDFRAHAASIDVPAAVVVTTKDRLVRPRKQRQLAAALPTVRTYELDGDHDAAAVLGDAFPRVTAEAVEWVLARAGRQGGGGTSSPPPTPPPGPAGTR
jgi:pimeloyl-ACP methyl ester carboxylesterase